MSYRRISSRPCAQQFGRRDAVTRQEAVQRVRRAVARRPSVADDRTASRSAQQQRGAQSCRAASDDDDVEHLDEPVASSSATAPVCMSDPCLPRASFGSCLASSAHRLRSSLAVLASRWKASSSGRHHQGSRKTLATWKLSPSATGACLLAARLLSVGSVAGGRSSPRCRKAAGAASRRSVRHATSRARRRRRSQVWPREENASDFAPRQAWTLLYSRVRAADMNPEMLP